MNCMYRHPRVKSGIISQIRAETVYTGSNVVKEKEELCDVFMAKGYPEKMARPTQAQVQETQSNRRGRWKN